MSDDICEHNFVPAKIDEWEGWWCTRCAQRSNDRLSFTDVFFAAYKKNPQAMVQVTQELLDASGSQAREMIEKSLRLAHE